MKRVYLILVCLVVLYTCIEKGKAVTPEEPWITTELPTIPEDTVVTKSQVALPEAVRVNFYFNQAIVTTEAKRVLNQVVEILHGRPELNSILVGHTCDIGPKDHNKSLSENRVKAVKDYLISQGISKSRIIVEHFGETRPLFNHKTSEEARILNRRVDVKFDVKTGDLSGNR